MIKLKIAYSDVPQQVLYRVGQNLNHFQKFTHDDTEMSKTDILAVAIFKYSLHKFRETILH